jgi:hypothetical protein
MAPASRVIVIDNVEELDLVKNPKIDLSMWLVNESVKDASFSALIKNALRNNPDYIMVAEARGGEMLAALVSAMSGHPNMDLCDFISFFPFTSETYPSMRFLTSIGPSPSVGPFPLPPLPPLPPFFLSLTFRFINSSKSG